MTIYNDNADKFDEATHLLKAAQELCRSRGPGREDWRIADAIDLIEEDEPTAWNAREAAGILTEENHHKNINLWNKPYRTGALQTIIEEAIDILQEIADSADEDEETDND